MDDSCRVLCSQYTTEIMHDPSISPLPETTVSVFEVLTKPLSSSSLNLESEFLQDLEDEFRLHLIGNHGSS
jgi:hypothetical protein